MPAPRMAMWRLGVVGVVVVVMVGVGVDVDV